MLVEKEFLADLIPVDVVINAMIVAAWKTAQDYTGNPTIPPVYNVTSGSVKPINWGKYCSMSIFTGRFKAMKSSPLLRPFCVSEFWGFSLLNI